LISVNDLVSKLKQIENYIITPPKSEEELYNLVFMFLSLNNKNPYSSEAKELSTS